MPDDKNTPGSWQNHQLLVLHELQRHSDVLERLEEKMDTFAVDHAALKVRVSLWAGIAGAVSGMVPPAVILLIKSLTPHK